MILNSISKPLLTVILCVLLSACQLQPTVEDTIPLNAPVSLQTHQTAVHGKHDILIINSNASVERYRIAEEAFEERLFGNQKTSSNRPLKLNLANERHPIRVIQDFINKHTVHYIYSIGAKALGSVEQLALDQPMVFSSVLNWQRYSNKSSYQGVASDIAATSQLTMFKHFFPEVTKLGIMYSQSNQAAVKQAASAAAELGISLETIKVANPLYIEQHIQELSENTDALWLLPDPVVLSSLEQAQQLMNTAHDLQFPVFSSNRFLNKLGTTFTISADLPTVGRQAAVLIQKLQRSPNGDRQSEQNIHYPIGSHITLNLRKVEQYKLELNYQALDSVNELEE